MQKSGKKNYSHKNASHIKICQYEAHQNAQNNLNKNGYQNFEKFWSGENSSSMQEIG